MDETRCLYVLRHAKSSWDDASLPDHERPLSPRGRRAVKLLAAYVEVNEIRPELVLCSTARRTRDTLEGVLTNGGTVLTEPGLYDASCSDVVERLRRVPPETHSVMVVGHNPAMQMLVLRLARGEDQLEDSPESLSDIQRKFPTGALATLTFPAPWAELGAHCAELVGYVRPKSLLYQ